MKLELTDQQFRYLLDLVYIGNWVHQFHPRR